MDCKTLGGVKAPLPTCLIQTVDAFSFEITLKVGGDDNMELQIKLLHFTLYILYIGMRAF